MPSRFNVGNLLTGVLVICAVIITGLLVRRELFPARSVSLASTGVFPRREIRDWSKLRTEGRLIGSASAPYTFVEFADFQCPYCRDLHFTLQRLVRDHPQDIAVVYRHFPLPHHTQAMPAAVAAECAGAQGRFESYANLLFQLQDSIGRLSWDDLASRAEVQNMTRFRQCQRDGDPRSRIERDIAAAGLIGVSSTPTIVLRNQMVAGAMPLDTLVAWMASFGAKPGGR